ncbi:MAG: nucleotide exchange factor GrpE [Candidatus Shapirobacteria bacterium]|jgi:molecular chaperone GrpE
MTKKGLKQTNSMPDESQDLKAKITEINDKLARSLADYANLEKRIESQRQLFFTMAVSSIIIKMVDVLDDLYLAQDHLKDRGLEIAINKFVSVLKSEGLEEVNACGKTFNPETMDCVDVGEGKKDLVLDVRKRGYTLNCQNIRPAQVVVGREPEIKN